MKQELQFIEQTQNNEIPASRQFHSKTIYNMAKLTEYHQIKFNFQSQLAKVVSESTEWNSR